MTEQYRQNGNDYGPDLAQSFKTAGRVNRQKYTVQTFSSKGMKRSEHINGYQTDRFAEVENVRESEAHYPHSYLEIENGFKKFKNSQIIALQQLRQEYEILKNLPIDDKLYSTQKVNDSMTSSVHADQRSQATSKSKIRRDHSSRDYQLLNLEKKQLEIVISNSMKKIEELLHQQMEYKKQIHTLKIELEDRSVEQKYESIINNMKRSENEYQETIQALKRECERQKQTITQLNQRISKLEAQNFAKDLEIKKQLDERRRFDDSLRHQKDKYLNMEIGFKRLTMQYEMLQKDKESQIKRLLRDLDYKGQKSSGDTSGRIKMLEEEIEMKDKRYQLLLDQLSLFQKDASSKTGEANGNDELKLMFSNFLSTHGHSNDTALRDLRDKISQVSSQNKRLNQQIRKQQNVPLDNSKNEVFVETIKSLLDKVGLPQSQRGEDDNLKRELEILRRQIEGLKITPDIERRLREQEETIRQLQSIVREFQKIIEDENIEKVKFMEDLKHLKQQHSSVYSSNDSINKKLGLALERELHYKHEIQMLKNQLQALMSTKGDLTASKTENHNLKMRVIEMERLQDEIERLRVQCDQLRLLLKTNEDKYLGQIRQLRRKNDQVDFEVSRARKQGNLNVELLQRDHLSETSRYKMLAEQTRSEKDALQNQMQQSVKVHVDKLREMKEENSKLQAMYERKLIEKNEEIEHIRHRFEERIQYKSTEIDNLRQPFQDKLRGKQKEHEQLRKYFDNHNSHLQSRHEQEMSSLMKRIDSLNDANDKFMQKNEWYLGLEQEILELRRKLKYMKSTNEAIDHLWQVKQAEYGNVHEILRQLKVD